MASNRTILNAFLISLCLLVTVQATEAVGATYYVSTSGNDSAGGSNSDPWRTIQQAANVMQPGDEVRVADGVYSGFYTTRDGTASNPILFRANGINVVLNTNNGNTPDIINIEGHDFTHIIGFTIQGASRAGIRVVEADGCVVRDCVAGANNYWGIFTAFTPNIQILNNVCYASVVQHGIYVSNSRTANDNPIVRGNEVYGNAMNGIQLNGDCYAGGDGIISGAIIENNLVHDNNYKGFSMISVRNSIIQNNIVYNNGVGNAGAGGLHLTDEPGCGNPSNDNLVVNNTFVESRIVSMRLNDGATNNTVFNNLTVNTSVSRTILEESSGNAIDNVSNLRLASTAGLFVDDVNGDYHLAPDSPAKEGGTSSYNGRNAPVVDFEGDSRPSGSGYDIGGDESAGGGVIDLSPPTVAITTPSNGAGVSGVLTVSATATDDVGVAGVQFRVNGANLGVEDVAAPYETTFNTATVADGPSVLSALARDASGKSTVSTPVNVTVSNGSSQSGIIPNHPRVYVSDAVLANLRAKACYDNNGNPIGGCTPTADWNKFKGWVDDPSAYYQPSGADIVVAYLVTGDNTYAQKAISKADETIADMSAERADSYLYVYSNVKTVAAVYDNLYNQLSASKRTAYINYMNQVMTEVWNPRDNPYHLWSGWGINQPGNNYFYSFMLATMYAGLALYNENPSPPSLPFDGTTYTDIFEFCMAKIANQTIPYLANYGKGGGWHEGVNYRIGSFIHMFEMFMILRNAGGDDFLQDLDFPAESLYYQVYILQPGNEVLYPGGDLARESSMSVSPYDRAVMLLLADGLKGKTESQYAQHWLENVLTEIPANWKFLYGLEYLLKQDLPSRDFTELPLGYRAEGADWVNSRSSWSSDAVCVSFICADLIESHQHFEQNGYVIFKNGWQAVDAATYSHTGIIRDTYAHNTLLVDGWGQRLGEGTGNINKYELTSEYSYTVGDASDAYYGGENGRKDLGDPPLLTHFEREFVHVFPDFVVVLDRITPVSPSSNIKNLIHSRYQPTVQGNLVTAGQGDGKFFHRTLLPQNASFNTVPENLGLNGAQSSYRVEITPGAAANHLQLNVVYVSPSSVSSMPLAELFTTTSDNMIGTKLDLGGRDAVLLFSKDPLGAPPPDGVLYEIGLAPETNHYLMGLKPSTPYRVDTTAMGETLMVVVSEGPGSMTSDQGTLRFITGGSPIEIADALRSSVAK